MNIIIVGCGRVGAELAYRLFRSGHKVVVIDRDESAFMNLPADFRGRTVHGEAMYQGVLSRADIEQADGVAVVTSSDSVNTVVGHLARTHYQASVVIVRNFDSRWRSLQEAFDLQTISSSSWGAQRVEELLHQNIAKPVFWAGNGEVEIYEFSVIEQWDGCKISDLIPGEECSLVALTRAGHATLPSMSDVIQHGDIIMVSSTLTGGQALRKKLDRITKTGGETEA